MTDATTAAPQLRQLGRRRTVCPRIEHRPQRLSRALVDFAVVPHHRVGRRVTDQLPIQLQLLFLRQLPVQRSPDHSLKMFVNVFHCRQRTLSFNASRSNRLARTNLVSIESTGISINSAICRYPHP